MIFSPVANFGHHPLLGHFGPVYLLQVSKNDVEAVKFLPQFFLIILIKNQVTKSDPTKNKEIKVSPS